ncbi:MAG: DNA polymerase III subunit gamma/tau [Gammaproteobacteria bacterium]|nr:DNA polymerase III subunit gamma/tau [Gammaproteobacteria bacterium]MDX2488424.1 DNA polymerase III subunit gamma/tau [Gammaproteobacteria bacterium]
MSYKVLARKWRPGSFTDVVGQEHILQSLSHALDSDRLHHALLFTGTRGVGKTTIARILAKALNCEEGISSTPCGKCASCMAVDEGRFIDLIEVDAASRTKVDDTRELLDNVQYLPTSGRYKVYLIDEVHMLSRSSFNALLKTLEEPPDHVKFLLATTDPQKLPVTVLSRCLQFNLKRLDPDQIKSQLVRILEAEKIESENEALDLLARSADGSMRDGLSLLDQAIAFGAGKVVKDDVRKMLGSIEQQYIHALIESLANNDTEGMFQAIDDAADRSPDFIMVLDEMIGSFYQLSLAQMAPVIIEQRSFDRQWLEQTSNKFSAEQLQLNYQICLTGKRDLPLAPDSRTGFEMLMLRLLAFRPDTSAQPVDRSGSQAEEKPSVPGISRAQQRIDQPVTDQNTAASETKDKSYTSTKRNTGYPPTVSDSTYPESDSQAELVQPGFTGNNPAISEPSPASVNPGKLSVSDSSGKMNWSVLVESLPVTGLTKQLALHMAPSLWDEAHLELLVDVEQEAIHSATREKELISVLQENLGENIKISIRIDRPLAETPAQQKQRQAREKQQAAEESIMSDPSVAKMVDAFGASVAPGSIRPVN